MVGPAVCREAVGLVQAELKMSQRQACHALGVARSSMRYRSIRPIPVALLAKLKKFASQRPRWGYRKLCTMLRRDGEQVNHKRVYRLYKAEGLLVRTKVRKRMAAAPRLVLPPPTRPNERRSMDFVHDVAVIGRKFRVFTLIDDFTRKWMALEVGTSLPGARLARLLGELGARDTLPATLASDNGPEFTGQALDKWAAENNVNLHFIRPGKPTENAFIESFNGRFRNECLNTTWFTDLDDARRVIEAWRNDYNDVRPHGSLDGRTPSEYERDFTHGLPSQVA